MLESLFTFLYKIDELFWGYFAFTLIALVGLFFTLHSSFFQIRALPHIFKIFYSFVGKSAAVEKKGVHPLRVFFASVGGMIGVGNLVGIVTAIQLGGPGALIWVWFAGMVGAIVKYCETYLGLKYRIPNKEGGFDGGPMYFLAKAFRFSWIPALVAFLLCIYGIEIYQFSTITETISTNWNLNRIMVACLLLGLVFYAGLGGIRRIGRICSWLMPFFITFYLAMGMWVILKEFNHFLPTLQLAFKSAFTGHAALGGFAGSTMMLALRHGIARAAYSADIGVGYDSIIHSESSTVQPEKQAGLAVLGVFVDNLICTFSILVVLLSGVWLGAPVQGSELIQTAFDTYFPYMKYFIPVLLFLTGYTTTVAYFVIGIKCARFLAPKWGKACYLIYGMCAFMVFSFIPQNKAQLIMSIAQSILLIINLIGIFRLRKEIQFITNNKIVLENA